MAALDIAALVAHADLPVIAAASTEIKQRGREYVARCVFHSPDENPSLSLFHRGGKWQFKCFSCGEGGDALDWVEKTEGIPTSEALKKLNGGTTWTPLPKNANPPRKPPLERAAAVPPGDAGEPDMELKRIGKPSRTWTYRTAAGEPLLYIARYDTPEGKQIRAWCWGGVPGEDQGWYCGHYNRGERPLYNLDQLSARKDAAVMVVEGEKAADAASALLPSYVVTTWPGGSNGMKYADLEPLRGRRVDLWPDADEPGRKVMAELAIQISDLQGLACHGKLVDTADLQDGFDAADWQGTDILEWLRARATEYKPIVPPAPAEMPPAEFPPEATLTARPSRARRPRLQVVDGNTVREADGDPEDEPQIPPALSEDSLADHFADLYKDDWRCVAAWGKWFRWDGDGWAEDREDGRIEPMRNIFRSACYWKDAPTVLTTPAARAKFCRQASISSAVRLAGTDKRLRTTPEVWDADPWLLGIPGGVVDLKTGSTLESSRDQCITMRTAIAPERGRPDLWLKMLDFWSGGDQALVGFLRRYFGYAITGDAREQCMAFFYGPAQSGKGTIMRTLAGILGSDQTNRFRSYHYEAPISTFMASNTDRHSTELAALFGKRLITAEEPSAGARWDEGKLKWITGGSQITARFIARDNFSFTMTGKIIVAANHRPRLATTDKAIQRRLHVVPFEHPVADEDRDNGLDAKLREEWPRILHWLLEGCLEWQESGLGLPERIAVSTERYLESEDTLGAWVAECCEREGKTEGKRLYDSYSRWCDENGEQPYSRRGWANALSERGFHPCKGSGGIRMIEGLQVKAAGQPADGYEV